MAYTIFDMLIALLMGIVIFIFSYLVGMALLPTGLVENKGRKMIRTMLAPISGFSVFLAVVNFLYQLSSSDALVSIVVFPLAGLIIFLKRKKIAPLKDFPWLYMAISMIFSCIAIYAVYPKIIDGGLYFPRSAYDHARIALVDSIEKNGLPLFAPWSTNKGELIPVGYHYGIHVLMGYFADITEMNNMIVATAIHWIIAEVSVLLVGALAFIISKRRGSLYITLLLLASSSASYKIFENIVPARDRFGFWPFLDNLIWCPHHIMAASMVVLLIFLVEVLMKCETKEDSLTVSVLIGFVAAASAYCSIYSGAVAVFFYCAAFLISLIFDCKLREKFKMNFGYFVLSIVVGVIFAFPYLMDLIKNAVHVPTIAFGYVPFIPLEEGIFAPLITFIKMYLVYLPIRVGVQYIFGFIGIVGFIVIYINRKRKQMLEPDDAFKMRLVTFTIFSFVIIFFIHSAIYSNDFGWRTVAPAKYILIAFGSAVLVNAYDMPQMRKLPVKIVAGLVLFAMCFGDIEKECEQIFIQRDDYHELHKELADIREGWTKVQECTDENDIVLCAVDNYPEIFPDWGSGTANYMFSYYANRYSPMGDYPYAVTSGASMGQDRINELHARITEFFDGNPTEEEVDYFADVEKVKAIFVVKQDGLYTDEGTIRSRYPQVIEGKNYKIYY